MASKSNVEYYQDKVRAALGDLFWQQFKGEEPVTIKIALGDLITEIQEAIDD